MKFNINQKKFDSYQYLIHIKNSIEKELRNHTSYF